ncbi:extracellular dihydrogeodin oxidase/laccase, putative [Talaromyces stipitatus ATCC 10500]|uniref:laccase n=1 Tax=Talaromyces stipitatus (strain ATCC 10500 / CBS 375.48 / QM 6759 / NRRL 1006) TaxID=441959 RepID=B8MHG8_TALSN|nr:extracellular dihydrogeodin oxidase/laccase, putative [Talaromyces stipitatus ATCC 10500]EED17147.1 extracellular dihydrogeodin oxidase/laccase, putative [Talaromyces stipitatus ATCC 10500]
MVLRGILLLSYFLFGLHMVFGAAVQPCSGNTAADRSKWCTYNIHTDYYNVVPDTGVTREYWFDLRDRVLAPDGIPRYTQSINGSIPGPTIRANWGDEVVVHVQNNFQNSTNGTSLHFHGIRQNYTNQNDGVVSVTECPTAPGHRTTYKWRAAQYGTTFYHSHFSLQAWEGVFGAIVIDGPASANYDVDQGALILTDWGHQTPDEIFYHESRHPGPTYLENGLINGMNIYNIGDKQVGQRFTIEFQPGTSYRLRLINAALDTHFTFSIDHHTMTVIAADLVPLEPFTTNVITIGIGQRYDVIVKADQARIAHEFWMRAVPQNDCSRNNNTENIRGIVYYGETVQGQPSTSGYNTTTGCVDQTDIAPIVSKSVSEDFVYYANEALTIGKNTAGLFVWQVNDVSMQVEWENPTLLQIYNNVTDWSSTEGVIQLDEVDKWIYVLIQSSLPISHPMHLHGHDFFVLAQGTGAYEPSAAVSNFDNPPRRDTAMLLAGGYLLLAFQTDNPGAWLLHCHVGFHATGGLAVQFVERYDEIRDLIDYESLSQTCKAWDSWEKSKGLVEVDSGI